MRKKILWVCKGNTCRSPMAMAIHWTRLNFLGHPDNDIDVESAGILEEARGKPAAPEWTELKAETGIDLSDHRSRYIGDLDLSQYDPIICAEPSVYDEVKRRAPEGTTILLANEDEGGIMNPYQKGLEAYRQCYPNIQKAVAGVAQKMCELEAARTNPPPAVV